MDQGKGRPSTDDLARLGEQAADVADAVLRKEKLCPEDRMLALDFATQFLDMFYDDTMTAFEEQEQALEEQEPAEPYDHGDDGPHGC